MDGMMQNGNAVKQMRLDVAFLNSNDARAAQEKVTHSARCF